MTDEPSMEEILASIRRILGGEDGAPQFDGYADVVEHLKAREFEPNGRYGMFQSDATVLSFRANPKGESILADIKAANDREGGGNVQIPNSDIELINFSVCAACDTVHSFRDLESYYAKPTPMAGVSAAQQLRQDVRVACKQCGAYFLPALVISDGTPKSETQFLCRTQVIEEIETALPRPALTKRRANILTNAEGRKAILNDVLRHELDPYPGLVVNFIQYMPAPHIIEFVTEQNVEAKQVLYGMWA